MSFQEEQHASNDFNHFCRYETNSLTFPRVIADQVWTEYETSDGSEVLSAVHMRSRPYALRSAKFTGMRRRGGAPAAAEGPLRLN